MALAVLGLAAGAAMGPPPARAQWIELVDETAERLILRPFAEDPWGDPMADPQEKDMAAGDLDHDGWTDLVVVRKRPFSVPGERQDVLLMNEGGVLVDRTAELAPGFLGKLTDARDVVLTDVDGDGWLDVAIANTFGEQPRLYRNAGADAAGAWRGLVDESALRLPPIEVPRDVDLVQFCGIAAGDVDGDDRPELYFANYRGAGGNRDVLLLNDGGGRFLHGSEERLGAHAAVAFGTGAEIVDVDGDGDRDIVKLSALYEAPPFPEGQFLLFNDDAGGFADLPFQELPTAAPYMFASGDLDGDGRLDLYLQGDVADRLLLAESAEPDVEVTYAVVDLAGPRTDGLGGNTHLADLDGDGDLDAGVGPIHNEMANCGGPERLALLENPGDGLLRDPWPAGEDQPFHLQPHDFAFLDVDGDGCTDLVQGLCEGWAVFVQQGCGALLEAPLESLAVAAGAVLAGDLDSLRDDDDDRLVVQAERVGDRFRVDLTVVAVSPEPAVARLGLALESAADAAGPRAVLVLPPLAGGDGVPVGAFALERREDLRRWPDVAGGPGVVDPVTGEIGVRLRAAVPVDRLPGGFRLVVDQLRVAVVP